MQYGDPLVTGSILESNLLTLKTAWTENLKCYAVVSEFCHDK